MEIMLTKLITANKLNAMLNQTQMEITQINSNGNSNSNSNTNLKITLINQIWLEILLFVVVFFIVVGVVIYFLTNMLKKYLFRQK